MDIKKISNKYKDDIIELRRHFHKYPEVGLQEFKTVEKIIVELKKYGVEFFRCGKTGIVATIRGSKMNKNFEKCVALRADIDALEVEEKTGFAYASVNKGISHACGHDFHTAMLLGAVKVINDLKNEFSGEVKFLFQPAEEIGKGALDMIENGAMKDVDFIIGMHVFSDMPTGKFSIEPGPRFAAASRFSIEIEGEGGHGARPHETIDPILAASSAVVNLQSIVSREIDPQETAVITIGSFHSGSRFNVIPTKVELTGTARTYSLEVSQKFPEMIERVVKSTVEAYRAKVSDFSYSQLLPPTINDEKLTVFLKQSVKELYGEEAFFDRGRTAGGEDFSFYLQHAKGVYLFLGCGNEEKGYIYPQHHEKYMADEDALQYGVCAYVKCALDYLNLKTTEE